MSNLCRTGLLVLLSAIPVLAGGASRLELRVSPPVSPEPAYVRIQIRVESNPDNRLLEVVAESPDFRRSSEIALDGERAPRLTTVEFHALPAGTYEVSGTLIGQGGSPSARFARSLLVAASPSRPR